MRALARDRQEVIRMDELDGMRWAMAEERFAAKDYRGAGRLLTDIVAADPTNQSTRLLLARSHFHAALLQKAYDECVILLDQNPTEPYARLLMARTCDRLGRKAEARAHRRLLAIMTGDDSAFEE
jgi:cytochrome c-type biogenesis protein CcmH/NrfG